MSACERDGRRSIVLALFGFAWVLQGLALFFLADTLGGGDAPVFIHEKVSAPVAAATWLVPGLLGIALSLRKRKKDDTLGFLAVSVKPLFLTASYGVGSVAAVLSHEIPNVMGILGLFGFSIWGVITTALALVASWPEVNLSDGGARDGGEDE